jgi:hypothetical protein
MTKTRKAPIIGPDKHLDCQGGTHPNRMGEWPDTGGNGASRIDVTIFPLSATAQVVPS